MDFSGGKILCVSTAEIHADFLIMYGGFGCGFTNQCWKNSETSIPSLLGPIHMAEFRTDFHLLLYLMGISSVAYATAIYMDLGV